MTLCCTLAVTINLLAISISSPKVGNFIDVSPWIPTNVTCRYIFGSDEHTNATHRVTSNTFAAVKSIFDAYYERIYFKSAGSYNDQSWNTNLFGQTGFKDMSFSLGVNVDEIQPYEYEYRRQTNSVHRLIEWPCLIELSSTENNYYLHNLVESRSQIIYRNSWDKTVGYHFNYWSSSLMNSKRLPKEFEWTSYAPTYNQIEGCLPIFAFSEDEDVLHFNSFRENLDKYPIGFIYYLFDQNYFYLISDMIERQKIEQRFIDFIDDEFNGSNAETGMKDISRRLKPDDYYDYSTGYSSSLLATESRVLSVLDRTYELPCYCTAYNVPGKNIKASSHLELTYRGSMYNIYYTLEDEDSGSFICDTLTDSEMSLTEITRSSMTNTSSIYLSNIDRDKATFGGSSTSINHKLNAITNVFSLGQLSSLYEEQDIIGDLIGMNIVSFVPVIGTFGGNTLFYYLVTEVGNYDIGMLEYEFYNGLSSEVQDTVFMNRHAESSYTLPITMNHVSQILPVPVPCGSAFGRNGYDKIAKDPYVSFFNFAIKWIHDNPLEDDLSESLYYIPSEYYENYGVNNVDVYRKVSGSILTTPNSLVNDYYEARRDTHEKMMGEMRKEVPEFNNPSYITDSLSISCLENNIGSRCVINGGSFGIIPMIDSIPLVDIILVADIESVSLTKMRIKRLGYKIGDSSIFWFSGNELFCISVGLSPINEGGEWTIDRNIFSDLKPVSCEALSIPLVTTDWKWNCLQLEKD